MYVYNTENVNEDIIHKVLDANLAVDIRLDNTYLLSKDEEIMVGDQSLKK